MQFRYLADFDFFLGLAKIKRFADGPPTFQTPLDKSSLVLLDI